MDADRAKPRKPAANSPRPAAGKRPASKPAIRAASKPPAPKRRTGLIVAGGAGGVVILAVAIGAGFALLGATEQNEKKSPAASAKAANKNVVANAPNAPKVPAKDPPTAPRGFTVRQENGIASNPTDDAGPPFRVEDGDEPAAPPAMPIAVTVTDPPNMKPDPAMSLDVEGPFEMGKPFIVRARVAPKANDSITLLTTRSIDVVKSEAAGQFIVGQTVNVEWRVQTTSEMEAAPIKVALKSGASIERRITVKLLKSETPTLELAIAAGKKDNTYTVSATVENAKPLHKLTLKLPSGVQRIEGDETAAIPEAKEMGKSIVDWTIQADKNGSYPIAVELAGGAKDPKEPKDPDKPAPAPPVAKKVLVVDRKPAVRMGPFVLAFEGEIEPGKNCTLVAEIADPAPGQKLTLELPRGMFLKEGNATQDVPENAFKFDAAPTKVRWQVRPAALGTYPVRVVSSTGVARTRILVIDEKR